MADSLAPGLLIAVPQLLDPNFRQTVVLLLRQGEHGAMGVVINRESRLLLRDLCKDHDIPYRGSPSKLVRMGGPVQPEQGLVLFGQDHEDPEAHAVIDGLYVSASTGTLTRLCSRPEGRFHCYAGYSGWAPDQLEREIQDGSWILAPVSAAYVLDCSPDEMWALGLAELGIDPAAIVPGGTEEA